MAWIVHKRWQERKQNQEHMDDIITHHPHHVRLDTLASKESVVRNFCAPRKFHSTLWGRKGQETSPHWWCHQALTPYLFWMCGSTLWGIKWMEFFECVTRHFQVLKSHVWFDTFRHLGCAIRHFRALCHSTLLTSFYAMFCLFCLLGCVTRHFHLLFFFV